MIRSRHRIFQNRFAVAAAGLALIGVCLWAVWSRRQGALDRWMTEMRARGEKFTMEDLLPRRTPQTNNIMDLIESAAARFKNLERSSVGQHSRVRTNSSSEVVGWADTNLYGAKGQVLDWEALGKEAAELQDVVRDLRVALENPPFDTGTDYSQLNASLNFAAKRQVAQSLFDLILYELHRGNLTNAHENLRALMGMTVLHSEDGTVVGQMIRSAIMDLTVDAIWETLQANGWTSDQLAAVQDELARFSFFNELATAFQVERARCLRFFKVFRKDPMGNANLFGASSGSNRFGLFDRVPFFLWQRLWSEQDGLLYLQVMQGIDCLRELDRTRSFAKAAPVATSAYERLERELRTPVPYRYCWSSLTIPNYKSSAERAVKNETRRQLAIAALAIARYKLRHARLPETLSELTPEFLSESAMDFYNGQPLRYRPVSEGGFILYSVGANFRDDGGDGTNDLVWPKPIWPRKITE